MRTVLVILLVSIGVRAAADVRLEVELPSIVFPSPPALVLVQPGVQVVEDYDDEVFFVDGWYWVRRGPHWYKSPDHTGGWVAAPVAPGVLVRIPRGKFKHYKSKGPKPKELVVVDPDGREVHIKDHKQKHKKH